MICQICKKEFKKNNALAVHVKCKHNILSFKDYYDKYIKTFHGNKCKVCGSPTKWWKNSYRMYCSNKCINNDPDVKEKMSNSIKNTISMRTIDEQNIINQKRCQTMVEKHGVENISQLDSIKRKKEKTSLKNYGEKYYWSTEEYRDHYKKVMIEKYGVNNPLKSDIIKNNIRKNSLEKWKVDWPSKSEQACSKVSLTKNSYTFDIILKKFEKEVIPLFNKNDYLGGRFKQYQWKCVKCGNIFESTYETGGAPRCFNCYPKCDESKQNTIKEYIQNLGFKVECDKRKLIYPLELDIFIPEKNIAFEFDGVFWHSELGGRKQRTYHLRKTIECQKHNIMLIHIFEDEWDYNKNVVLSRIKNILGRTKYKIYARDCTINEIDNCLKNKFLNKYHLQGEDDSKIKLGLFYKNRLISVMTFGVPRMHSNKDIFELYRFCGLGNFNIIGGASKLLKYFEKKYKPTCIITYADRRWSNGNLYYKLGFNLDHISRPSYWYTKYADNKRIHRFNYRKSKLELKLDNYDKNLTEWQNMINNGYDRIWDCGNYVFIKYFNNGLCKKE